MSDKNSKPVGGSFLLTGPRFETLSPDDFSDEQLNLRQAVRGFVERNVVPHRASLEAHDYSRLRRVLKGFADDAYLGAEIPEAYGGAGLGIFEAALIAEGIGLSGDASFGVSTSAHNGIGTWPIMHFGNEEQKSRFLPKLASGEMIAAYSLTEDESGSDALAAKTKAVLVGDEYVLNGRKRFITNAGVADLFTVFAKVDGKNAVFLVERSRTGVSIGKEEHKMGINGSSTCEVILDDVHVPAANLLGAIGNGHKIVMNTLNLGRFKLGAGCVGGMKYALEKSVRYAAERRQFGRPIIEFDDVRRKIADMAIDIWVGEACVYRLAGLLASSDSIEEFEAECAIVKVLLSEMLWKAADTAAQIFGGNGYIEEYPTARLLRDARINRVFEGTNEINRLRVIGTLLKRAKDDKIDIGFVQMPGWTERDNWEKGVKSLDDSAKLSTQFAIRQAGTRLGFKCLMAAGGDKRKMTELLMSDEQQTLFNVADMCILTYAMDAAAWRVSLIGSGGENRFEAATYLLAAAEDLYLLHRRTYLEIFASDAAAGRRAEAKLTTYLLGQHAMMNGIALRRQIADETIARILK